MQIPDISPMFPGGPQTATRGAASAGRKDAALIPLERWAVHKGFRTLPDGTPLNLTPDGVDLYERITGDVMWPETFGNATVLLWVATRTDDEMNELWSPAPAREPDDDPEEGGRVPALFPHTLVRLMRRWRNAVIPAGATAFVHRPALDLWRHENETAVELDHDALPDAVGDAAEKKSPDASLTGWSWPSMPSAEETAGNGTGSGASAIAPSSPCTGPGSTPVDFPLSPLPPD